MKAEGGRRRWIGRSAGDLDCDYELDRINRIYGIWFLTKAW